MEETLHEPRMFSQYFLLWESSTRDAVFFSFCVQELFNIFILLEMSSEDGHFQGPARVTRDNIKGSLTQAECHNVS